MEIFLDNIVSFCGFSFNRSIELTQFAPGSEKCDFWREVAPFLDIQSFYRLQSTCKTFRKFEKDPFIIQPFRLAQQKKFDMQTEELIKIAEKPNYSFTQFKEVWNAQDFLFKKIKLHGYGWSGGEDTLWDIYTRYDERISIEDISRCKSQLLYRTVKNYQYVQDGQLMDDEKNLAMIKLLVTIGTPVHVLFQDWYSNGEQSILVAAFTAQQGLFNEKTEYLVKYLSKNGAQLNETNVINQDKVYDYHSGGWKTVGEPTPHTVLGWDIFRYGNLGLKQPRAIFFQKCILKKAFLTLDIETINKFSNPPYVSEFLNDINSIHKLFVHFCKTVLGNFTKIPSSSEDILRYEKLAKVFDMLIEKGVDVNRRHTEQNITPLMYACQRCHGPLIFLLLHNRADSKAQDRDGNTALHYLAKAKFPDKSYIKSYAKNIIMFLCAYGADQKMKNNHEESAADIVQRLGRIKLAQLLNMDFSEKIKTISVDFKKRKKRSGQLTNVTESHIDNGEEEPKKRSREFGMPPHEMSDPIQKTPGSSFEGTRVFQGDAFTIIEPVPENQESEQKVENKEYKQEPEREEKSFVKQHSLIIYSTFFLAVLYLGYKCFFEGDSLDVAYE